MESTLRSHYEVIELLPWSPGEFADSVYKARESTGHAPGDAPGRIVMLRLLPTDAADSPVVQAASDRYASLPQHPNILTHYGIAAMPESVVDRIGNAPVVPITPGMYAVSEWSRGISLKERVRRVAPFGLAVTLDVAIAITQALMRAESLGVAHGDLRTDEVIITPEGHVKVADFGLSRAIHEAMGEAVLTEPATRSVARLMYEMLTAQLAPSIAEQPVLSPNALHSGIAPAVNGIVQKASMIGPDSYPSLTAMLADLQTAREDARSGKALNWSPLAPAPAQKPVVAPKQQPEQKPASAATAPAIDEVFEEQQASMAGTTRSEAASGGAYDDGRRSTRRASRQSVAADPGDYYDDEPPRPGMVWLKRIGMLLLGLIVIGVVFACAYFAMLVSNVPSDITVPNLIGKQLTDAQSLADQQHFRLAQVGHDYSDTWPQGAIYQQTPISGRSIKAGKSVSVFVSDGPFLLDVPDLSQTTLEKARSVLSDAGLPVGSIDYIYDTVAPKGLVTAQQPAATAKVARNTAVNLTVSKGPPPPPAPDGLSASSTIPGEIDLSWNDVSIAATYNVYRDGKKVASALPQTTYSDVGLDNDTSSHSYTVAAVDANGESAKSAPAVATATPGSPVTSPDDSTTPAATDNNGNPIGSDAGSPSTTDNSTAPAAPVITPNQSGSPKQRQFSIQFRVPRQGGRHNVEIEVQDATGTNIVYDEDRESGDRIDESFTAFGNRVIFRILIDGKLVKQQTK